MKVKDFISEEKYILLAQRREKEKEDKEEVGEKAKVTGEKCVELMIQETWKNGNYLKEKKNKTDGQK